MSGPPAKPRNQRTRRGSAGEGTTSTSVELPFVAPEPPAWAGEVVELDLSGFVVAVPKPPTKLLKQSVEAWAMFWVTPESSMIRPHHLPALRRLVRMYDEEERLRRRVAKSHVITRQVPVGMDGPPRDGELVMDWEVRAQRIPGHLGMGSQGQLVRHPDVDVLMKLRERIQMLEDRFAATPLAEYRVGWQRAAMFNEEARARETEELAAAASKIAERHAALREGRP